MLVNKSDLYSDEKWQTIIQEIEREFIKMTVLVEIALIKCVRPV
jgi:hypothetical protein